MVAAAHFWGHKDLREFDALPLEVKAEQLQFYIEEAGRKSWESYQQVKQAEKNAKKK